MPVRRVLRAAAHGASAVSSLNALRVASVHETLLPVVWEGRVSPVDPGGGAVTEADFVDAGGRPSPQLGEAAVGARNVPVAAAVAHPVVETRGRALVDLGTGQRRLALVGVGTVADDSLGADTAAA